MEVWGYNCFPDPEKVRFTDHLGGWCYMEWHKGEATWKLVDVEGSKSNIKEGHRAPFSHEVKADFEAEIGINTDQLRDGERILTHCREIRRTPTG